MKPRIIDEFVQQVYPEHHQRLPLGYRVAPARGEPFTVCSCERLADGDVDDGLAVVYTLTDARTREQPRTTLFDLTTKRYTKRRTDPEVQIIAFMNTFRARFVPVGHERVGVIPVLPQRA